MEAYRDQYATVFNGGKGVVGIAMSTDDPAELASWAKEKGFPLLFASDEDAKVGALYDVVLNLAVTKLDRRVVFVIGPDGRVAHVMRPFKELSPAAYQELDRAVDKAASGGK